MMLPVSFAAFKSSRRATASATACCSSFVNRGGRPISGATNGFVDLSLSRKVLAGIPLYCRINFPGGIPPLQMGWSLEGVDGRAK